MTKTILAFAATAVLVAGTFVLGSAFAVETGDVIAFKGKTNKVFVDPASDYPSKAKAKVGIQLVVDGVNEFVYDGLGRIVLEIGFKDQQNTPSVVVNDHDLNVFAYTYDDAGNILTIPETEVQSDSGEIFTLSGEGSYNLDTKNKSRGNFTLSIGGQEGGEIFSIPVYGAIMFGSGFGE